MASAAGDWDTLSQRETNQFCDFLFKDLDLLLQGVNLLSRAMEHSHSSTRFSDNHRMRSASV